MPRSAAVHRPGPGPARAPPLRAAMICLLIGASHEGALEAEIRADASGEFIDLVGVPRALLPSGVEDKRIIDISEPNARTVESLNRLVVPAGVFVKIRA